MELERVRSTVLRGTFHVYELAALVAAARYVTQAAPPEVPAESLEQLRRLLDDYDRQVRNLSNLSAPHAPAPQPPTAD
ncbi:hypothetical protein ACIHCQ_37545 [Streptomyces sp. NPDC052236]|uniref:hypothetical protein n=1 Tax=Streptomyces sp. NPDC052236 TaxID=3365686 RepID=UPI0037D545F7